MVVGIVRQFCGRYWLLRLRWLVFFLCLGQAFPAFGQQAEALLDHSNIASGESTTLTVRVTGGSPSSPRLPQMADWTVRYIGQSTSFSSVNLSFTQSTSFNYLISPQRTGTLTIPPISVKVDGQVVRTQELKVKVGNGRRARSPGVANNDKNDDEQQAATGDDVFVESELTPREVYVGEQIRQTLSVYSSVPLGDATRVERHQVPDTIEEPLPDSTQRSYTKNRNGRQYQVEEISWVFYPLTAGVLEVPPTSVRVSPLVQIRRSRRPTRSLFDDFFRPMSQIQPQIFSSKEQTINVKPLPRTGRPDGYSGLVGKFRVSQTLPSRKITLGDSATVTVTVTGEGNLRNLTLPPVEEENFKVYDDSPVVNVSMDDNGRVISKGVFKRAFVPQASGNITIPPVVISYFNPDSGQFEQTSTHSFRLEVAPGASGETTLKGGTVVKGLNKKAIEVTGEDILPIHTGPELSRNRRVPLQAPGTLLALSLPAFLFGIGSLFRRIHQNRHADPALLRRRSALRDALAGLKSLKGGEEGNERDNLDRLSRILRGYIGDKLSLEGASLISKEARTRLEAGGVAAALAEEAEKLLDEIEQTRYAPGGKGGKLKSLKDRTRALLEKLEKELG